MSANKLIQKKHDAIRADYAKLLNLNLKKKEILRRLSVKWFVLPRQLYRIIEVSNFKK